MNKMIKQLINLNWIKMKIIVSILVTIAFAWTGFAQVVENKNSEKLENEK